MIRIKKARHYKDNDRNYDAQASSLYNGNVFYTNLNMILIFTNIILVVFILILLTNKEGFLTLVNVLLKLIKKLVKIIINIVYEPQALTKDDISQALVSDRNSTILVSISEPPTLRKSSEPSTSSSEHSASRSNEPPILTSSSEPSVSRSSEPPILTSSSEPSASRSSEPSASRSSESPILTSISESPILTRSSELSASSSEPPILISISESPIPDINKEDEIEILVEQHLVEQQYRYTITEEDKKAYKLFKTNIHELIPEQYMDVQIRNIPTMEAAKLGEYINQYYSLYDMTESYWFIIEDFIPKDLPYFFFLNTLFRKLPYKYPSYTDDRPIDSFTLYPFISKVLLQVIQKIKPKKGKVSKEEVLSLVPLSCSLDRFIRYNICELFSSTTCSFPPEKLIELIKGLSTSIKTSISSRLGGYRIYLKEEVEYGIEFEPHNSFFFTKRLPSAWHSEGEVEEKRRQDVAVSSGTFFPEVAKVRESFLNPSKVAQKEGQYIQPTKETLEQVSMLLPSFFKAAIINEMNDENLKKIFVEYCADLTFTKRIVIDELNRWNRSNSISLASIREFADCDLGMIYNDYHRRVIYLTMVRNYLKLQLPKLSGTTITCRELIDLINQSVIYLLEMFTICANHRNDKIFKEDIYFGTFSPYETIRMIVEIKKKQYERFLIELKNLDTNVLKSQSQHVPELFFALRKNPAIITEESLRNFFRDFMHRTIYDCKTRTKITSLGPHTSMATCERFVNIVPIRDTRHCFDAHPFLIGELVARYDGFEISPYFNVLITELKDFEAKFFKLLRESKRIVISN